MAINKKLIHFKTFNNFNSKKLSANVENTKYTLGVNGEIQTGSPDILYLSIVYIKDTQQLWTHGLLYNNTFIEITYLDLVDLKKNNKLIPGYKYKIIDYVTKVASIPDIKLTSVEHPFDIIVIADSINTLNENAFACVKQGDDYFINNDLHSWKLKYCIDNDKTKFTWVKDTIDEGAVFNNTIYTRDLSLDKIINNIKYYAFVNKSSLIYSKVLKPTSSDTVFLYSNDYYYGEEMFMNGSFSEYHEKQIGSRGIIYYMQDEFGNEASYDFKNILINSKYTFGDTIDDTILGNSRYNKINNIYDSQGVLTINNIILGNSCSYNTFESNCKNITLGNSCQYNSFDFECSNISLGFNSNKNVFGKNCSDMTFGTSLSNKFGNLCRENKLGSSCNYNTFLDACVNNTLLDNVKFCTLEKYCYNNIIPKSCSNKRINSGTHDLSEGFWDSELNEIYNYLNEYHTIKAINGHEYVDLGLPSGLKWATCNVGANSPEAYGDYFAWGETTTKETYTEENCETCGKELNDISGDVQYDTAAANWGDGWRMPTNDEIQELIDNCIWTWTTYNGVNGYNVEGLNGNSIFLPAAGYRFGSSLNDAGTRGTYQSSIYSGNNFNSCYFFFNSNNQSISSFYRRYGRSVRPVLSEIPAEPQLTYTQYIPNEASMPTNPIEGVLYLIGDE